MGEYGTNFAVQGWAAVYCRLSREDEDKTARESESIRNQRELLLTGAGARLPGLPRLHR